MDRFITLDREKCDGYGNCVFVSPKVFDLDADNRAVLLTTEIDDSNEESVALAIAECPMRAIATIDVQPGTHTDETEHGG